MAVTSGLVQRIKIDPFVGGYWVYIGPSPTNTTLFTIPLWDEDPTGGEPPAVVERRSMVEALSGALFARREVRVYDEAIIGRINGVEVVPG